MAPAAKIVLVVAFVSALAAIWTEYHWQFILTTGLLVVSAAGLDASKEDRT